MQRKMPKFTEVQAGRLARHSKQKLLFSTSINREKASSTYLGLNSSI